MNVRKLRWLLAGWVVALVVPGIVAATVFDIDTNSTDLGGPLLVWIVGYLVQFGLFMAASRISTGTNIVGWLVASLLPWVCDWTTVAARWAAVPCAAVAVLVAWRMQRSADRTSNLTEHGIVATGTVLEVIKPKLMNVVINNVYIKRKLRLRIARADGVTPYEGVLDGLFMLGEIPGVGDQLALRIDPDNPQHFESVDDASTGDASTGSTDAAPEPRLTSWPAATATTTVNLTATGATTTGTTTPGAGIVDELDRLTRMHASGGLSDEEFARAKARVLDG